MAKRYSYDEVYDKDTITYSKETDRPITGYLVGELINGDSIEVCIRDGKKEGISKIYDKHGWLKIEVNYHEDKKQGSIKEYDAFGDIVVLSMYKDNIKDGETKQYRDGKLWLVTKYKKGEKVSIRDVMNGKYLLEEDTSIEDGVESMENRNGKVKEPA